MPIQARVQVRHKGIKRLSSSNELGAQHVSPHQKPKRPHLQEKDMPVAFICSCHVSCQKLEMQLQKRRSFWLFGVTSLERTQITGIPGTSGAAGDHKMAEKQYGHLLHFT